MVENVACKGFVNNEIPMMIQKRLLLLFLCMNGYRCSDTIPKKVSILQGSMENVCLFVGVLSS